MEPLPAGGHGSAQPAPRRSVLAALSPDKDALAILWGALAAVVVAGAIRARRRRQRAFHVEYQADEILDLNKVPEFLLRRLGGPPTTLQALSALAEADEIELRRVVGRFAVAA